MPDQQAMQNNRFDFNSYYSLRGYQDINRNLTISAFNGGISIDIWDRQHQGGPVDKTPFSRELCTVFSNVIDQVVKAQPNTRIPVTTYAYVRNSGGQGAAAGKFEKHMTFTFVKDEKQMYSLEIHSAKLSSPLKCLFKMQPIMINTDDLSDSEKSMRHIVAFKDMINKELPLLRAASRYNMVKNIKKQNTNASTSGTPSYTDSESPY